MNAEFSRRVFTTSRLTNFFFSYREDEAGPVEAGQFYSAYVVAALHAAIPAFLGSWSESHPREDKRRTWSMHGSV